MQCFVRGLPEQLAALKDLYLAILGYEIRGSWRIYVRGRQDYAAVLQPTFAEPALNYFFFLSLPPPFGALTFK